MNINKLIRTVRKAKANTEEVLTLQLLTEIEVELEDGSNLVEAPVKPANGGQIYLLYKRLLGYSDMTPILVAVFAGVEKALDEKYKLQKDDHANSYFIEDSRLSV
jgi:hypothetical protein